MRYLTAFFALALVLRWLAVEANVATGHQFEAEREMFQAARVALRHGDQIRFEDLYRELEGYPLRPYLHYWKLRRDLTRLSGPPIREFLDRHADLLIADRLRNAWLTELARRKDWRTFLDFYTGDAGTARECHYRNALLATGKREQAFAGMESIWLAGKSQPKACDPVFTAWRQSGRLTKDLVWTRISLAMENGQTSLANYLSRFLPESERSMAALWIELHKNPRATLPKVLEQSRHSMFANMLAHGLKRLARRDAGTAAELWETTRASRRLPPELAAEVETTLALRLASDRHSRAREWLLRVRSRSPAARNWLLRLALEQQDWPAVLQETSAPEAENDERRLYWRARTLQLERKTREAEAIHADLARQRGYYGFLSADALGGEYRIFDRPINASEQEKSDLLAARPGLVRARELFKLGMLLEARREWYETTQELNEDALLIAAKLAQDWRWHDTAILTVAKTSNRDDLDLRFPLAFRDEVEVEAGRQRIEPAWVFAVMRQESAFGPRAESHAGARGLMQLMPGTARAVARSLKAHVPQKDHLFEPELNIQLGTAYLRQLLDRHDNHLVLAAASYNAGPHRVRNWLPEKAALPADIWVELIPFRETRGYVRRILAYTAVYEKRLGREVNRLSRRMERVPEAGAFD